MTSSIERAEWIDPSVDEGAYISGLKIYNSLTKKKELFVPKNGNLIKWYICGPTVYDSSHMGHARNYVSFDVIRRILEDYFGYNIFSVMNITDIDDKIILQARKNYLLDDYLKNNSVVSQTVVNDVIEAYQVDLAELREKLGKTEVKLEAFLKENKNDPENKKIREFNGSISLLKEKIVFAEQGLEQITSAKEGDSAIEILNRVSAQLSTLLDNKHGKQFEPVLLRQLVRDHSARYEEEYLGDMKALGVRPPDVLSRVSEYVDEIIEMTQKIIENGYGYESNGSCYFNTVSFHCHHDHFYAKLEPTAKGVVEFQEESEGKLTDLESVKTEKQHPNDFALWKASKPGEPYWESPWGLGRPGWHIECSAMAGALLGDNMDIHSGGEDLKFPHHDNEMAQAEAYFDNNQWVNYFLHSGHLHIDGLKMSKSLKNFITIGDILADYSSRQIRLLYLLQAWDRAMNYERGNPMGEVDNWLHTFSNFFLRIENSIAASKLSDPQFWRDVDKELNQQFLETQNEVDEALKDNFDTATALQALRKLISKTNSYISSNEERRSFILNTIGKFVTKILRVFGLIEDSDIGLSSENSGTSDVKGTLRPYLDIVTAFRTSVRKVILNNEEPKKILQLSDEFRDNLLGLGVRLIDDGDFSYDFLSAQDVASLQDQAKEKEIQAQRKQLTKLKNSIRSKKSQLDDAYSTAISTPEYMLNNFSVILNDDNSIAPNDSNGEEISKGRLKKINRSLTTFLKKKEKFSDPELIPSLESEIEELTSQATSLELSLNSN